MSEAKRKRQLAAGVQQICDEGQGVWRLTVIILDDVPGLFAAAVAGDDDAGWILPRHRRHRETNPARETPLPALRS